jgi:hypothetical protein
MKLPKWPRLYVAGDPVTPEQADLILVRTNGPRFHTNDEKWNDMVARTFGLPIEGRVTHEEEEEVIRRFGMLDINHLNNGRISSTYAGGPNGWCDWDGTIGCVEGHLHCKWPSVTDVFSEWNMLARAFPFLRLTAQLTTDGWEDGGDGTTRRVLVQWEVKGGMVHMVTPGPLVHPVPLSVTNDAAEWAERQKVLDAYYARRDEAKRKGLRFKEANPFYQERGVTWARLKTAVERARVQ